MRIAVDLRLFYKDHINNYEYFIREVFVSLAQQYSEHEFLFFCSESHKETSQFPHNAVVINRPSKSTNPLLPGWLRDFKLSGMLKKHKADIFISTDGTGNLSTSVTQLMVMPDLEFIKYPVFSGIKFLFSKHMLIKYISKAKTVATLSEHSMQQISDQFKTSSEKIVNIGIAAGSDFKNADWREKEKIKEQYTGGCEYFIFTGGFTPAANLLNLLKAFTLFKTRQRTNMKLVIADVHKLVDKDVSEKLKLYKLKNHIRVLDDLTEQDVAKLVAGAYAAVHPFLHEATGINIIEAMQCEVPVIVSDKAIFREIAGNAALYIDPEDPASIAEQLKVIFKDENLRSVLIDKGKLRALAYTWQRTTKLMMEAIDKAVSN